MTILLTGGGTGGHITPILAVAHEIKRLQPTARVVYVGERRGKFSHLLKDDQSIDVIRTVSAGKFRRYHGESWLKRLIDLKTGWLNLRDGFLVVIGVCQSYWLLKRQRPDVILLKGGFVGVPIGLCAAALKIPFITHDSDAVPGLANRLVGRWARYHATGMPAQYYSYQPDSVRYTGVLVGHNYRKVTAVTKQQYKGQLSLPPAAKLLVVTGGSLGARRLNKAMRLVAADLLARHPDLHIIHQVGKGNAGTYAGWRHDRLQVLEFLKQMHVYTGAADVVISRAGANTLAELGVQGKAVIVVPNPLLTGGHQLKNSGYLTDNQAVLALAETDLSGDARPLYRTIAQLIDDQQLARRLGNRLHEITKPAAAQELAELLLGTAAEGRA